MQVKKTIEARKFFLTIPRYEMGSETSSEARANDKGPISVKERIKDLLICTESFLSQYMIGEESHVDGSKHYHVYLKYSKKRNFSFLHFDYLGKHGKLEVCRSPRASYMYISKEDKAPLANFDYEGGILSGKPEEIAKYLSQTGRSYSDLFLDSKPSIHALATKWRTLKAWENERKEEERLAQIRKEKKGIKRIDKELMKEVLSPKERKLIKEDLGLQKIIGHINQLVDYKWQRPFKMKNLLIWSGKPGIGKTSLIRKLGESVPLYGFPVDQWFEGYKSHMFWGILWNEMNLIGIDIEMLKNFLEGTPVRLNIKGSKVEKYDNPQVFMTANFSLEDMIKRKYGNGLFNNEFKVILDSLKHRIEEVNLDNYENIFFLSNLIVSI